MTQHGLDLANETGRGARRGHIPFERCPYRGQANEPMAARWRHGWKEQDRQLRNDPAITPTAG